MAKKEKQTEMTALERDDALFETLGKNKKKKKRKIIITVVSIVLVLAIIAVVGVCLSFFAIEKAPFASRQIGYSTQFTKESLCVTEEINVQL